MPEMMVDRYKELLEQFGHIQAPTAPRTTFLEAAGYPHFENVASNLLAFFLDPDGEHGLGTLFLDALLKPLNLERLSVQRVERETGTENGKRIDLFIECDTHVIGVENKIFAAVYNPLSEYRAHLQSVAKDRPSTLMLLCLREPPPGTLPSGVVAVTYEHLMKRVRENIGVQATDAPAQYLTFVLDFAKTMENLRKEHRMNPEVIELFRAKEQDAIAFLQAARDVRSELRRTVQRVRDHVSEILAPEVIQRVRPWLYREGHTFLDDVVHDVAFGPGETVAIDAYLDLEGWRVEVWQRECATELSTSDLRAWLQEHRVPFLATAGTTSTETTRLVNAEFTFDAPLDDVATHVAAVVTAIAHAATAPSTTADQGAHPRVSALPSTT